MKRGHTDPPETHTHKHTHTHTHTHTHARTHTEKKLTSKGLASSGLSLDKEKKIFFVNGSGKSCLGLIPIGD